MANDGQGNTPASDDKGNKKSQPGRGSTHDSEGNS